MSSKQLEILKSMKLPRKFKNFKELCSELKIPEYKGNQKKSFIKELNQCANIKQKGHTITIKEIYESIKPTNDKRKQTLHGDIFDLILLDHGQIQYKNARKNIIAYTDGTVTEQDPTYKANNKIIRRDVFLTPKQLMSMFNIINENYKACMYETKFTSKFLNINHKYVKDFFDLTRDSNFKILDKTMKKLENKRLLTYTKWRSVIFNNKEHAIASEELVLTINYREYEVLKELQLENMWEVIMKGKMSKFKSMVLDKLKKQDGLENIESYYNTYKLIFVSDIMKEKELAIEYIESLKQEANKILRDNNMNNVKKRHERQNKAINNREGNSKSDYKDFRANKDYVETYKILEGIFNDPEAISIVDDFEKFTKEEKQKITKRENDAKEYLELIGEENKYVEENTETYKTNENKTNKVIENKTNENKQDTNNQNNQEEAQTEQNNWDYL